MTKDEWKAYARNWLLANIKDGEVVSGNDIWRRGIEQPSNRRLLGAVLLGLEAAGHLRRIGQDRSEGGHGQRILLWKRVTNTEEAAA